jgi:hypothetical protein
LIEALFAHHVLDNLRAAQGVVSLAQRYGADRLEAACARALAFDCPRYRTVKTILDKGMDQQPLPLSPAPPLAPAYTGQGRFCRDSATLFAQPVAAQEEAPTQEVAHAAHA